MELYEVLSPSGREAAMVEFIKEKAERAGFSCRADAFGNLICEKGGTGKKFTIECGMDTVCIMKTAETKDGMLKIGVPDSKMAGNLAGSKVQFQNKTVGVIRCGKTEKIEDFDLSVDIGETDREAAAKKVPTGEFGTVVCDKTETGRFIFGNGVSTYAPIETVLRVMEKCENKNVSFVFTAQKKFAGRGIKALLGGYDTDYFVSVNSAAEDENVKCGGGAVVIIKDKSTVLSVSARKCLIESGKKVQLAATEENLYAELPQICGNGAMSGCVCLPVRDKDKPYEGCMKDDIESAAELLLNFCGRYDKIN